MPSRKTNILRYCPMCNCELEASNFFTSKNPHHNGYLLYCKDHCNKIFKDYLAQTKQVSSAMWFTCAEVGVPFVSEIFKGYEKSKNDKIEQRKKEINPENGKPKYSVRQIKDFIDNYKDFSYYVDALRKTNSGVEDWSTFMSGTDIDFKDIKGIIKSGEVIEAEKQQYLLNWGQQDNIEDYQFLDNCFEKYTKGVEFTNSQQEDLYRDLCRDRLLLRKINDGRYNGDETIDKVQTRIGRLMSTLKVDEFENNKPKTISEQLLFQKIAQIEETKPADLYKDYEKYRDVSKLRKYEQDMVYRPLKNDLLGTRDFNVSLDDIEQYKIE